MKPPSSVISDRHGHSGQKVLAHLAQLQQQNALLKESLALSQRENALQQELITKLQAQHTQQQKQITQQQEQIVQLQEKVEALEAEIRRLKKLPPKPDIKPNTKPPDDSDDSPGDPPAADQIHPVMKLTRMAFQSIRSASRMKELVISASSHQSRLLKRAYQSRPVIFLRVLPGTVSPLSMSRTWSSRQPVSNTYLSNG